MLIEKVKRTLKKHDMIEAGDRVVVAVSGGPDSVCLLGILHALSAELGISLHVAHLNHMFREKEAEKESAFVEGLSKRLGIPCTIESYDVPAYCIVRGLSAQAGAREIRYAFLERVAEKTGATRIALGHTAADQAETFIMRALRGAGRTGLSGIPPVRGKIIRPLIEATQEEVLSYLYASNMDFVTDSSNLKPIYDRNRVRLELMPVLKRFKPRVVEALAREATILRDEDIALDAYISTLFREIVSKERGTVRISLESFLRLLPGLKRRILRKAVELADADPERISYIQMEDALRFMQTSQTGGTLHLTQGILIEREYDAFVIGRPSESKMVDVLLPLPGSVTVPYFGIEVESRIIDNETRAEEISLWQAAFDYDKIAQPIFVRNRRHGDRFCPAGMAGRGKKLQDYFTDEKVPRRLRDNVPILASERDILWVVGMRTDERFLPDNSTKRILLVNIRRYSE